MKHPSKRPGAFCPHLESLEDRELPTGVPHGFLPAQITTAYGINTVLTPNHLQASGAGQTIAVIEDGDDPRFSNPSLSPNDLQVFDAYNQILNPPSFKVIGFNVSTGKPIPNPYGDTTDIPVASNNEEYSLDVEWAHAMAPGANMIVVEFNWTQVNASPLQLVKTMQFAASLPGVSVVTSSWLWTAEPTDEAQYDSYLKTPNYTTNPQTGATTPGHQGVTIFECTGDDDFGNDSSAYWRVTYPANSPYVVAVGGTSLGLNSNNTIQWEEAWNQSSGGVSTQEPKPSYQGAVNNTNYRETPDVSFLGDWNTGVAVYDSFDYPKLGWEPDEYGGTSLATPMWAGIMTLVDQDRATVGLPTMDGYNNTLPALYSLRLQNGRGDFNPITKVYEPDGIPSNDPRLHMTTNLNTTYNTWTGLGSPNVPLLVSDLAGLPVSFSTSPTTVYVGASFSISLRINAALAAGTPVTLTLVSGLSHWQLTAVTNSQGIVTFPALTVNLPGTYQLMASVPGNPTDIVSTSFMVFPSPLLPIQAPLF